MIASLLLLILGMVSGLFLTRNQASKPLENSLYQVIAQENYVIIADGYAKSLYGDEAGQTFSTQTQEFYGDDLALKDGQLYGGELDDQTAQAYYKQVFQDLLLATQYLELDKAAIKAADYTLTLDLANIWPNLNLSEATVGNNEILSDFKDKTLKCLRIHFDRSYRPTRIEGYYQEQGERSWFDLLYISYPTLDQKTFASQLDAYIQTIQSQTDEDEEVEETESSD